MWPLNNENKQQLDKKRKKCKIMQYLFFRKKFISKDIERPLKKLKQF